MTDSEIKELAELFKEAEANIKLAELEDNQGFSLPAVNEFRYALKHLTVYLENKKADEFIECKAHIKRAICDALEMRILVGLERVKRFDSRYWFVSISPIIPNWISLRKDLENAKKLLASNDENIGRALLLTKSLEQVNIVLETIEAARSELNKSLFKRLFSFIGSAIAFLAACLTIYKLI